MAIIATIAHVSGYEQDLWTAEGADGRTLLTPLEYYAPYLTGKQDSPYTYDRDRGLDDVMGEYRAATETAHRRFPDLALLQGIVETGGPEVRGLNEDPHITGFNALVGAR